MHSRLAFLFCHFLHALIPRGSQVWPRGGKKTKQDVEDAEEEVSPRLFLQQSGRVMSPRCNQEK